MGRLCAVKYCFAVLHYPPQSRTGFSFIRRDVTAGSFTPAQSRSNYNLYLDYSVTGDRITADCHSYSPLRARVMYPSVLGPLGIYAMLSTANRSPRLRTGLSHDSTAFLRALISRICTSTQPFIVANTSTRKCAEWPTSG